MQDDEYDSSPNDSGAVSRRDMANTLAVAVFTSMNILTTTTLLVTNPSPAMASGGATAGGVYLLSAKQRYNARVTAGIKTFLSLENSLSSGTLEDTKAFFTSDTDGNWKDSAAAGYLLANHRIIYHL